LRRTCSVGRKSPSGHLLLVCQGLVRGSDEDDGVNL
jgi:hypothetical protein